MRKIVYIGILLIILALAVFAYFRFFHKSYRVQDYTTENVELYPKTKDSIQTIKRNLKNKTVSEKGEKLTYLLSKRIFPYWYGTKWDFHGTTENPNEGEIACGYFVTTTLRDIGVPLNRVKLAQCASEKMIIELVAEKNIKRFSNIDIVAFENQLKENGNGLYIVGLDNHTGYLLLSEEGNYFIHSSGIFPYRVVKDKLVESPILMKSKYRVTGKISADERFLNKWITN